MHIEYMRSKEKELNFEGDPLSVTSLKLWHCKFKSLSFLEDFCNLKVLIIGTYPHENFNVLSGLSNLEYLSVVHMPKLNSLSGIDTLKNLKTLYLATSPSWDASGKKTVIESLHPIVNLPQLSNIELHGIVNPEKSLKELFTCNNLKTGMFSKYPKKEVEALYNATSIKKQRVPEIGA